MKLAKADNIPCEVNLYRMQDYISVNDACNYIGLPTDMLKKLYLIDPTSNFKPEEDRDINYHLQKIRYFIDNGIDKPIDIDAFCRDNRIYNWPVIMDGRHRYIAAIMRGDKFIPATYSGPMGLMDYLTYQSNNKPSYTGNIL